VDYLPLFLRLSDRPVLVVGGVQGFGLATARWLAERGAQPRRIFERERL
jgi:NAD(P)-dependent dehydrogenase (short-subunit alcohol dehydrogenase family)